MNELIKLTSTEEIVSNVNITLYEVAKQFGKRHNQLKNNWDKIVKNVTNEQKVWVHNFGSQTIDVKTGKGKIEKIDTYDLNSEQFTRLNFQPSQYKDN